MWFQWHVDIIQVLGTPDAIGSGILAATLKLILQLNNFVFDGSHYLQICRTLVGTRIGANYTSFYISVLENYIIRKHRVKPLQFIDLFYLAPW